MTEGNCERCGIEAENLYDFFFTDDYDGEEKKIKICWDCDWEITNGRGDFGDDPGEIHLNRAEEAYAYDPINNPRPF